MIKNICALLLLSISVFSPKTVLSQLDEDKIGKWYMYFLNANFKESQWGVQGDIQYRNWNIIGDLEQLLVRGGLTYRPKNADIKFTLGYGNITSGSYGPSTATSSENRIYQEALYPIKFGNRIFTNHRFRFEQRFVENQDFRTRYRYNLFVNIPLNKADMEQNTIYIALYNEVFINGQRNIGNNASVEVFDRNRFYASLGYVIKKGLKTQFGFMKQTTDSWSKNQFQLSLHHNI